MEEALGVNIHGSTISEIVVRYIGVTIMWNQYSRGPKHSMPCLLGYDRLHADKRIEHTKKNKLQIRSVYNYFNVHQCALVRPTEFAIRFNCYIMCYFYVI